LNTEEKNYFYGKLLREDAELSIGQSLPNVILPNPEGKNIETKSIISSSKTTLIIFWSHNSYRIDEIQEELKKYYNKYHSKGLNIIGLSADTSTQKWKAGIIANDLPWQQISDLKGKDGIIRKVYHEQGDLVTSNVLVDKNNKIIAWNVYGAELQCYLDQYLIDTP